jgi:hypothetical protein
LPWRTLVSSGVSDASGPAFCRAVLLYARARVSAEMKCARSSLKGSPRGSST